MVGRVAGKVAIITGAASGLGAESARRLAREGASLMLTDLATEAGEALASDLRAQGHRAQFLAQDVTDEAGWDLVVTATLEAFGRIDVLVNSAGVGGGGAPLAETTYENWRRITSINLDGTFLGMRAVVPAKT
jgi:NAD(P)-dependent dehydrogenase (short-subunit alcohol dehydrogenase family)